MKSVAFVLLVLGGLVSLEAQLLVRPTNLKASFMMGADVSTLDQVERSGGTFQDARGKAGDALAILKAAGINWIRLRLWVNPVDASGQPVGGGNNDLASYLRTAARAKKLGLRVEADFHYSDFWADPSKQPIPAAWAGLSTADLHKQMYRYTFDCLKAMKARGVLPDMVQIGNEINNGMMWPAGKLYASGDENVGGMEGLIALLKEGIRATRDTSKNIRIMLHAAEGGSNAAFRNLFDPLTAAKLDYDVIGLSFYPYWHGKMSDLESNMNDLASRYKKDLVVAESAYAYTLEDGDGFPNAFGPGTDKLGGYRATVQGQASEIADLIGIVAGISDGKGIGVFYWEPAWIPAAGAGWKTGEGNNWDNQALFDAHGKALPSLDVFRLVRQKVEFPDLLVSSVEGVSLKIATGTVLQLPKQVNAVFNDDSYRVVQVKWEEVDPVQLESVGRITVRGSVFGYPAGAVAVIELVANANLLGDAGFQAGIQVSGGTGQIGLGNTDDVELMKED
ncbi:MAG: glycosyl hydrolase 53 family protein [Spirochaetales bacterium]